MGDVCLSDVRHGLVKQSSTLKSREPFITTINLRPVVGLIVNVQNRSYGVVVYGGKW